jgi:hypothetical protein
MCEDHVAGRGAHPGPAHEDRRHHSASSLERQQRAEWQRIKARIRGLNEPLRFSAHLLPTLDALRDPRHGADVLRLLMECGVSAFTGGARECHGCCRRWTRQRALVAVGIVEFLTFEGTMLVGVCTDCWDRPDRLRLAVAGFQRDFGMTSIEVAPVHIGGRA